MTGTVRDEGIYGSGSSVSADPALVGSPVFQNVNTAATNWNVTSFDLTGATALYVLASWEQNVTLDSVVIDPDGGEETTLTEIDEQLAGGSSLNYVHSFGIRGLAISGTKTVRLRFSANAAGAVGLWRAENTTRDPTTGDFDSDNNAGTGATLTTSLAIGAGEDVGIIIAVTSTNASRSATFSGGLTATPLHQNQSADGGQSNAFSHNLGPLTDPEAPAVTFDNDVRGSMRVVLIA